MRELSAEDCRRLLAEGRVAHVAQNDRGVPYVTPLSYVLRDDDVVFRTAPGRRMEALQRDPRVCIEVSRASTSGWQSVILWGTARIVDDPSFEAAVVSALVAKYHRGTVLGFTAPGGFPEDRLVVAVTPEEITGRASGEDASEATRPGRL